MKLKPLYHSFILIWVLTLMMAICVNSVKYFTDGDEDLISIVLTEEEDNDDESKTSDNEESGSGKEKSSETFATLSLFSLNFLTDLNSGGLLNAPAIQSVISVSLAVVAPPPEV